MDASTITKLLADGPRSSRELGASASELRWFAAQGVLALDPDMFPGEYVPGNPLIARLPGDERHWPGWKHWNL